ncbi:FAD-dependent oxidoreductase [Natronosporangium hydrolyticum]|uniref:FAD-dependent oxidoreductase n=1 Tax=Natronosporangium hydrolyticum TaxID=2811111 RepID=A0A895YNA9_9ACTN|nr:FAD/NAD(P)-binding oxidoreductase [Natronosporangium hydrolyticum]QSB16186.1 FAD-dependent oxidoreductase [Natronosporangium hydrolyticum]
MTRFRGNWETGQRRSLRRVLVVGAGRAGVAAAEELRRQGFGGEVLIMSDEPEAPYDRPSCSKGLLTGHKRPADAKMPMGDDLALQWLMGRKAAHLDPERRVVTADTDEEFSYDGLVIATGARPVWPKEWPLKGEEGLYTLHGIKDAWQLRKALQRAKKVVVVGGGLTGCEVAYSVRKMARECVLVNTQAHVMGKTLGDAVGEYVTEEVIRDGVDLRANRRVKGVERYKRGWVVVLDDGSEIETDVVVATIGERPDTKWLADSGYDISDGVLCDENLRVVGGEDVVAAGTIARWPNLRYRSEPRRVGQWIMALEQGRAAASSLLGSDHPSRPAALVPRYWSEQFGLRIQVCGEVATGDDIEVSVEQRRGGNKNVARNGVIVHYHKRGEQVGVAAVNMLKAFTTVAREMLAAPAQLAEPPKLSPPAPPRRAVTARMIEAAPAEPPARHTIDVPASAVRDVSYEPYAPAYARSGGGGRRAAGDQLALPAGRRRRAEPAPEPVAHTPAEYRPRRAAAGHPPPGERRGYPEPPYPEPRYQEPRFPEPRYPEPRYPEPRYQEPRFQEPRFQEPRYSEAPRGRSRHPEPAYPEPAYPDRYYPDAPYRGSPRRQSIDPREPAKAGPPPGRRRELAAAPHRGPVPQATPERQPAYPDYRPEPGFGPGGYGPPGYGEAGYGEAGYGPPGYSGEPGYRPPGYGSGPEQASPHYPRDPQTLGYDGHDPGYEHRHHQASYPAEPDYPQPAYPGYGPPEPYPGYGPADEPPGRWRPAADYPVSPAVQPMRPVSSSPRPVSPGRSGGPRDRFTTEFAAVR